MAASSGSRVEPPTMRMEPELPRHVHDGSGRRRGGMVVMEWRHARGDNVVVGTRAERRLARGDDIGVGMGRRRAGGAQVNNEP